MKFLLPIDGSSASRRALNFATKLLDPDDDVLHLVCVVESIPIGDVADDDETSSLQNRFTEEAKLILDEAVQELKNEEFEVDDQIAEGDAGEIICETASERGVDGIILGRRGRGQVEEFLLGSVSNYVIHHADVPVTTVPHNL